MNRAARRRQSREGGMHRGAPASCEHFTRTSDWRSGPCKLRAPKAQVRTRMTKHRHAASSRVAAWPAQVFSQFAGPPRTARARLAKAVRGGLNTRSVRVRGAKRVAPEVRRRKAWLHRAQRSRSSSAAWPNPSLKGEAQRRAARPARLFRLSSASRACRPTVGPALAQTLGT